MRCGDYGDSFGFDFRVVGGETQQNQSEKGQNQGHDLQLTKLVWEI